MAGKSVSLSDASITWVKAIQLKNRINFSQALEKIVHEHKAAYPTERRRLLVLQLRNAAMTLCLEHDILEEAILTWVKEAIHK